MENNKKVVSVGFAFELANEAVKGDRAAPSFMTHVKDYFGTSK